jgi:hypothetical protein
MGFRQENKEKRAIVMNRTPPFFASDFSRFFIGITPLRAQRQPVPNTLIKAGNTTISGYRSCCKTEVL